MILDLIGGVAVLGYIVANLVGLAFDRQGATLHDVNLAVRSFMVAALAAFVAAITALMRVDANGWVPLWFAGFFLTGAVVAVTKTVARADRMETAQ